jgi:heme O synthase-like polyprenyltransferase
MNIKNSKLVWLALLHSLGIVAYVIIVVLLIQNGGRIFGQMTDLLGPIAFLLLFVSSAAITGALALGRPIMLFLENRKVEAIKMFSYTIGWLFLITVVVFVIKILQLRLAA